MNFFFLKIFIRNLSRKGLFPIINIVGLSIGLAAVLLICAFIFNEYSFDKQFTHHQRIYRANADMSMPRMEGTISFVYNALAPAAKEEIPGLEAAARIFVQPVVVKTGDVLFNIERFCWADDDFFLLFDTPFIHGSPEDIFSQPDMLALSESQAKVFFGDRDPLGEILLFDHQRPMEVRAVYRDFPANSSFDYPMIGHYRTSYKTWLNELSWGGGPPNTETFFLLAPGTDAAVVEAGMQNLVEKNFENPYYQVKLQPLDKIHLYSKDLLSFGPYKFTCNHGDVERVQLFSLLATIILLVACINYMNLSTARAQKRSKEIGISKTVGAKRIQIIARLYSETGILTFLSFAVAIVLALLLLPVFNLISGQNIQPDIFIKGKFLSGMLLVYLATTFIAASYPVLYLSGFAPITVIRQSVFTKGSSHAFVRKGLSVVQFSVATILIACVMIIHTQLNYMNNKDKGYNAHHVVSIPLPAHPEPVLDALKNDYAARASVSSISFSSSEGFPVSRGGGANLYKTLTEMNEHRKDRNYPANSVMMWLTNADSEIFDVLQLKLIAGATLPERLPDDTIASIVINRKAVEFLETTPEDIIGKRLPSGLQAYVCGVVEDFHFHSLHEPVTPYGIHNTNSPLLFTGLLLKVEEGNLSQQLFAYGEIFKKHFPNEVFQAQFPDLIMAKAYEDDRRSGVIVLCFSILAILVACMGVFGLSAFMAEQRTKEIGIRKVFGASVFSIVRLFTDNYLRLLALSLVIAIPVAWWIGGKYLEDFAYRISLSWWMFVAAALITVVLTLATVCWQAIKAATANPVKAIKSE